MVLVIFLMNFDFTYNVTRVVIQCRCWKKESESPVGHTTQAVPNFLKL